MNYESEDTVQRFSTQSPPGGATLPLDLSPGGHEAFLDVPRSPDGSPLSASAGACIFSTVAPDDGVDIQHTLSKHLWNKCEMNKHYLLTSLLTSLDHQLLMADSGS